MHFLDLEMLRVIWWALLGVLLIGFALTDGFDLGVTALLPFVARTDEERRVVINTIAPTWEGNQVWFILGGGAIFAAWPFVYAISFSGFYLAMFAVLASLILRPVGFKYRSKRPSKAWRGAWDWALFVGGFAPALVFGVAVGNVLQGAPFRLDGDLRAMAMKPARHRKPGITESEDHDLFTSHIHARSSAPAFNAASTWTNQSTPASS